ncbi:GNAT family N-acetyltransferase [Hasllibacter sp. MH4015]|uniref:GNAT family N-acetyltransferase n=1 Tax=Hasllibacter sp. MH4015 TaxID=2854029 RepID=UPI001CD1AD10|nr:GNAT family N-acetyltransferase [Hasllibacter sp. MH4015]
MNAARIFPTVAATWPPVSSEVIDGFAVPSPDAGGNRVSAARLADATATGASVDAVERVEAAMQAQGRTPLLQVLDHQGALSDTLDERGYIARDHTDFLLVEAASLARTPPPVTAFDIWPPLAIQTEIWEQSGIDAARRAVMARATCPKTSLFGRINDRPVGAAYIGCHNEIAMLHALEVLREGRRKGLASHMMRMAAKWAADQGALWLCVLVTQQNVTARRLYTSLGMKPVGTYVYREKEGGTAQ